ncbi:MAG: 3-deoxy-D-manno-octulosonic acid transferase, partial [Candidatus Omnitrophica bacterium]|nr:3-deoxy-D-manno-octulosonic acid transferase [Candidatus Omnitrophota bacterium]
ANRSDSNELWYWSLIGYAGVILAAPYYLIRMAVADKYRAGLRQRLALFSPEEKQRLQQGPWIWIHTVSVGELMAARPLLQRIKTDFPQYKILVSTVTDTGQNVARTLDEVDQAIYLPLDLYPLCQKIMRWIAPACLLIMETELWPNFIRSAAAMNIPCFLVNARLSDKSFKNYARFQSFFKPLLRRFSKILTQSGEDRRRFLEIGAPTGILSVMGNIKFEALPQIDDGALRSLWRKRFGIQDDEILLLCGSTFPGEESILARVSAALRKENIPVRLVIAPRHIERTEAILEELKPIEYPMVRRSNLRDNQIIQPDSIILLDTIGELRHVYAAADIVFMGKSLCGKGGQNPIEAAAWGKPVLYGKNMQNFRDIAALFTRAGAARNVETEQDLLDCCRRLCKDAEERSQMGRKAFAVVQDNQGALERIIETVQPFLQKANQSG